MRQPSVPKICKNSPMAKKTPKFKEFAPNDNVAVLGFFERHAELIASAIILLTMICGLMVFNMRIDEGGDDSTYICRAIDLVERGAYPTYQGPLYPIFLAIFVAIFGTSIAILKCTSFALILVSQYLFYRVLSKEVNVRLVFAVMTMLGVSSWYMFFACMTYSEAFFIVVEYLFFGALLKFENSSYSSTLKTALSPLFPGFLVVVAYLVRTVGFGFGLAGIIFLCLRRKFAKAAMLLGSTALVLFVWYGVRSAVWGDVPSGNQQIESLMQVHPYQPDDGMETLSGYAGRFVDNSNLYISKHLMRILGFFKIEHREVHPFLTAIFYALFAFGTFKAWKRNRAVLMLAVSSMVMLGITFVVLQALWDQYRLIIPYVASALVVVLYGLFHLFKMIVGTKAHYIALSFVAVCCVLSFSQTASKADWSTLRNNIKGDMIYGYTPDWYNYLNVCQVVYDQIPEGSYVACRKPNMARIYSGGHKFYGIYNLPSEDPDELIDNLRQHDVTHIVLASLRRDPLVQGAGLINTIHRYMSYVVKKYPDAFTLVGSCGVNNQQDDEPTYIFSVNYSYVDMMRDKLSKE